MHPHFSLKNLVRKARIVNGKMWVSGRCQCSPAPCKLCCLVEAAASQFVRNLTVVCGSRAEQSNLHELLLLFSVNNSNDTGLVSSHQVLLWVIVDVLVTTNNHFAIIYSILPSEQKFTWVLPVLLQTHCSLGHSTFLKWL